jgi:hypothetical protein
MIAAGLKGRCQGIPERREGQSKASREGVGSERDTRQQLQQLAPRGGFVGPAWCWMRSSPRCCRRRRRRRDRRSQVTSKRQVGAKERQSSATEAALYRKRRSRQLRQSRELKASLFDIRVRQFKPSGRTRLQTTDAISGQLWRKSKWKDRLRTFIALNERPTLAAAREEARRVVVRVAVGQAAPLLEVGPITDTRAGARLGHRMSARAAVGLEPAKRDAGRGAAVGVAVCVAILSQARHKRRGLGSGGHRLHAGRRTVWSSAGQPARRSAEHEGATQPAAPPPKGVMAAGRLKPS